MAFEIVQFLFGDLLRCPWCIAQQSGNVMEDVVMMFLLPTIIIILFVFILLKDLKILRGSKMMELLIGIGVYLFIVFGGYFEIFAELTKSYFIFLIFLLGVMYFVLGHFMRGGSSGGGGGGITRFAGAMNEKSSDFKSEEHMMKRDQDDYRARLKMARHNLDLLNNQIHDYENEVGRLHGDDITRGQVVLEMNKLKNQKRDLEWSINHRKI